MPGCCRAGERTYLPLLDQAIARGPEMDLVADFAAPLPMRVIAEMLGLPAAEWPRLRRWGDAIINLASTIFAVDSAASAAFLAADAEMRDAMAALLAERRAAPRDDLIARLATAVAGGERL